MAIVRKKSVFFSKNGSAQQAWIWQKAIYYQNEQRQSLRLKVFCCLAFHIHKVLKTVKKSREPTQRKTRTRCVRVQIIAKPREQSQPLRMTSSHIRRAYRDSDSTAQARRMRRRRIGRRTSKPRQSKGSRPKSQTKYKIDRFSRKDVQNYRRYFRTTRRRCHDAQTVQCIGDVRWNMKLNVLKQMPRS